MSYEPILSNNPPIYRGRALCNVQAGALGEFLVGTLMTAEDLAQQLRNDIRLYGRAYTYLGADGCEVRLNPAKLVVHLSGKDAP